MFIAMVCLSPTYTIQMVIETILENARTIIEQTYYMVYDL